MGLRIYHDEPDMRQAVVALARGRRLVVNNMRVLPLGEESRDMHLSEFG